MVTDLYLCFFISGRYTIGWCFGYDMITSQNGHTDLMLTATDPPSILHFNLPSISRSAHSSVFVYFL
ncbi:unnamed protein product [Leptosia nina]|uniref:Uncharacterized protein n=1 Tax=Leptosia nina TaxID=320188 RepID=A0AAV1JPG7_9NEOP